MPTSETVEDTLLILVINFDHQWKVAWALSISTKINDLRITLNGYHALWAVWSTLVYRLCVIGAHYGNLKEDYSSILSAAVEM